MRSLRDLGLILVLLVPAASADTIHAQNIWFFGNTGGSLTFDPTNGTLTLISTITTLIGGTSASNPGVHTGIFGTITVTTGPLISGSLSSNAIFSGGSITITTNGIDGLPNGIVFSGTLRTPILWRRIGNSNQFHIGAMGGGQLFGGQFFGISDFEQYLEISGTNQFDVLRGKTIIPEIPTAGLFATGLGLLALSKIIQHPLCRRRDAKTSAYL